MNRQSVRAFREDLLDRMIIIDEQATTLQAALQNKYYQEQADGAFGIQAGIKSAMGILGDCSSHSENLKKELSPVIDSIRHEAGALKTALSEIDPALSEQENLYCRESPS